MLFDNRKLRYFILMLGTFLLLAAGMNTPAESRQDTVFFEALQKKLVADGFDPSWIQALYRRPEVRVETRGVSLFLRHSEAKLNYDQFTTAKSIRKARKYMKTHASDLEAAENAYGVDKTVITAIILVETRLGTVVGRRSVLNSLSTMAALGGPEARNRFWDQVSGGSDYTRAQYDKWADRRSRWAYGELKAFLTYVTAENIKPWSLPGSYAGALGIAQFMPTNVLALARDGNNDGRIDLLNHADAIASVANYLKYYGWESGQTRDAAARVVYRYNHSTYYVNTVLKISTLLKG